MSAACDAADFEGKDAYPMREPALDAMVPILLWTWVEEKTGKGLPKAFGDP